MVPPYLRAISRPVPIGIDSDIIQGTGWPVSIMRSSAVTPRVFESQVATTKEGNNNDLVALLTCNCGGETQPRRASEGAVAGNDRRVWRPSTFSRWYIIVIRREAAGWQESARDSVYRRESVAGIAFGVGSLHVARVLRPLEWDKLWAFRGCVLRSLRRSKFRYHKGAVSYLPEGMREVKELKWDLC